MTNNQLTKERLQEIAEDGFLKHGESKELARMALAEKASEPVILYRERNPYNGLTTGWQELTENEFSFLKENAGENAEFLTLYRHAQPAPVMPEEKSIPNTLSMYAVDAVAAIAEVKGWNACRAAMLHAGNAPVNGVTAGKPLTIILPDISSKAFWSGSGKTELFHPETYRRWVKEAIEHGCIIACIDVEVK